MSLARTAFGLAACLALSVPALAAPPAAPSPVGVWEFKTGAIEACTISGRMTIGKTTGGGFYPCKFESVQACPGATPPRAYTVAQTCNAKLEGKKVIIKSKVDRIVSVKPDAWMPEVKLNYAPDDFTVEINPEASEMTGQFYSHGQAKVTFWRPKTLTS